MIYGIATKKPRVIPIHAHGAGVLAAVPLVQCQNNMYRAEWTTDLSLATDFLPPTTPAITACLSTPCRR